MSIFSIAWPAQGLPERSLELVGVQFGRNLLETFALIDEQRNIRRTIFSLRSWSRPEDDAVCL